MLLFNQNPTHRAYQLYTVMLVFRGETGIDYCPIKNYKPNCTPFMSQNTGLVHLVA